MDPDFLIISAYSSGAGTKITSLRLWHPIAFFAQTDPKAYASSRFYTLKVGDSQAPLLLTKGRLAKEFSELAETPVYKLLMKRKWNR